MEYDSDKIALVSVFDDGQPTYTQSTRKPSVGKSVTRPNKEIQAYELPSWSLALRVSTCTDRSQQTAARCLSRTVYAHSGGECR